MRRPGLGRGLDALLGSPEGGREDTLRDLPLDLLQRGRYQPRTHMDPESLASLAASIRAQGVVQPIVARPIGQGRYEIIAGERRWRAAQMAGLERIPAVVRECSDEHALALALIENIQREALNPIEEAQALHRLLEEFRLTHEALAERLGRSRAAISNQLRLLRLPEAVRGHLETGALSTGHARALLPLPEDHLGTAVQAILGRELNVRDTERLVRRLLEPARERPAPRDPDSLALEGRLAEQLGLRVRLSHKGRRGELRIVYEDLDQLDGLLRRLGISDPPLS